MKKSWITLIILLCVIILYLVLKTPLAIRQNEKGIILYDSTEYLSAEKHFSKALLWKGKYLDAHVNLLKSQLAQEKIEIAKKTLARLMKIAPEMSETYALDGKIMVLEKEYDKAITKLSQAIEKDSLLAYAWFYRGIAYANSGNLKNAASDYLKAQEIDQTNTDALREGAIVLSKLENFEGAIQSYTLLLELDPTNIDAYMERADFKQKIGDFSNAISDYNSVIELDPSMAASYYNRGKCYAQMEEYGKAIDDFIVSADMNHKTSGAKFNAGLSSLKLNNLPDAKKYLEESIESDENKEHLSKSLYLLGVLHMMMQKNSKALNYFNRSIEEDDVFADAYYNRGIAYGMIEKYDLALLDLEKSLKLGKTSADVYFAIGIQKISLKKFKEGCEDISTAVGMGHVQAKAMQKKYCEKYLK